jgi:membrane protease YdiL (CAAX protease family)
MATKKSPSTPKEPVARVPLLFTITDTFKIILQAVAIFIGGQVIGSLIVTFLGMGAGADSKQIVNALNDNNLVRFFLILLIELATFWLITLFLKRQGLRLKDIGVQKKILLRYVKTAALGYMFYFALFLAVISIVSALGLIDTNQAQNIGFEKAAGFDLVLAFVSLVVLPPLAEELLFRGYLFHLLKRRISVIISSGVVSILFAIAHLEFGSGNSLNWAASLDTLLLSGVLCYVTYKTKSLWPAIIIHALKNGVAFVTLFLLG